VHLAHLVFDEILDLPHLGLALGPVHLLIGPCDRVGDKSGFGGRRGGDLDLDHVGVADRRDRELAAQVFDDEVEKEGIIQRGLAAGPAEPLLQTAAASLRLVA